MLLLGNWSFFIFDIFITLMVVQTIATNSHATHFIRYDNMVCLLLMMISKPLDWTPTFRLLSARHANSQMIGRRRYVSAVKETKKIAIFSLRQTVVIVYSYHAIDIKWIVLLWYSGEDVASSLLSKFSLLNVNLYHQDIICRVDSSVTAIWLFWYECIRRLYNLDAG